MNITRMRRMWINQPSTIQPHHDLHGTNVLAGFNSAGVVVRVWFLSGTVESMEMDILPLSFGWQVNA